MKWKYKLMILIIIMSMPLWCCAAKPGQETGDADWVSGSQPDSSGNNMMPPLPLPPVLEKEILHLVFSRFPDLDPVEVMLFIDTHMREKKYEFQLRAIHDKHSAAEFMTGIVRDAVGLMEQKRKNPDLFDKIMKEQALAGLIERLAPIARHGKGKKREENVKLLRNALTEAFDIRQDLMKADVEQMALDLAELRTLIQKRQENREAIIDRRFRELTEDPDYLKW